MSTSGNCLDETTIAALADGDSAARDALAHLEACDGCRELVSAVCARRTNAARTSGALLRPGPGTMLGRHRIERPLGAGGMGIVYLARDVELDREVAIKLLRGRDDKAHARLVGESQALARLNDPNVVTAYEVGREGDSTYLIMEYVDGGTVRDWLALAPRRFVEIAAIYAQCARGLAAAHATGLIHRDVKPDNLLVGLDGRARVSDFGLASANGDTAFAGTPLYMAPEVLAGDAATAASDQWSLCASLWESLFGTLPFSGNAREELLAAMVRGEPKPPAHPELTTWLERALRRGITRDPRARFPSLDACADALRPPHRPFRRTASIVVASATLAAGIGAAVGARDPEPTCSSGVAELWNDARRARLTAHFRSLGEEPALLAEPTTTAISDYARRWSAQRNVACRAERQDEAGHLPALRAACLDSRRRALDTLIEVLEEADADATLHAVDAIAGLPALEDCMATERLAGRQPRPSDRVKLAELSMLERRFDAARIRSNLGQRRAMLAELVAIAEHAIVLDYHPLAADAFGIAGVELQQLGDHTAVETLRRALWAAQAGGDDRQLSDVAIGLVNIAAASVRPLPERDDLRAQARAAVARLRWRNDPRATAAASLLAAAEGSDDLARGALDAAERHLRNSVELGVVAFGPRSPNLSPARSALARILDHKDPDAAATLRAASIDVDTPSLQRAVRELTVAGRGAEASAIIDVGWRLYAVGRDDKALIFVRRARALPSAPPMFAMMIDDLESEIAVARGDVETARTLNARAFAALGPSPIPAHSAGLRITRAEILEASNSHREAADEYRAALAHLDRDQEARQVATLGLARCKAHLGDVASARTLIEAEVAAGISEPRHQPSTLLLLADLRWRAGERGEAREAARAAAAAIERLPALVADRAKVHAWLAAHAMH